MGAVMEAADLISAGLGLMAAIALGWPAFRAVRAKRYYERHEVLKAARGLSPENLRQMAKLSRRIEAMQLGGAREAMVANTSGAILLAFSFLFLMLAGIERRAEKNQAATTGRTIGTGSSTQVQAGS